MAVSQPAKPAIVQSGPASTQQHQRAANSKTSTKTVSNIPYSRPPDSQMLAVVLVRGHVDLSHPLKRALHVLRLSRKNHCVVVENTPPQKGMIGKVKDFVTWGPISEETLLSLVSKRGKEFKSRETDSKKKYAYGCFEYRGKKYKPYFALNPPQKGFGRKGIKVAFKAGGALGDRGDKMNDLILRML